MFGQNQGTGTYYLYNKIEYNQNVIQCLFLGRSEFRESTLKNKTPNIPFEKFVKILTAERRA